MQPFETFVKTLSPEYPLNVIAQAYMQDWYEGRPIDGGVVYETQLRRIPLDGSLASLATLDKFLDAVKPRLAPDAILLSQNTAERNLLTFIGFYAGLVFCYQANSPAYWVSFAHLTTSFAPLQKVMEDDFSYSMAVSVNPILLEPQPYQPMVISQTIFFPLVAIIERLYPVRNQPLLAQNVVPFFGFVSNSLLTSVQQRLGDFCASQVISDTQVNAENQASTPVLGISDKFAPMPETPNRIRFNSFRRHRLYYLSNNPFLSLISQQPACDEALFAPFGHPFIAPSSNTITTPATLTPIDSAIVTPAEPILSTQNLVKITPSLSLQTEDSHAVELAKTDSPSEAMTLGLQAFDNRNESNLDINSSQKNLAKARKTRQDALKKSLAEKAEHKRKQEIATALANPRIHKALLNQSHSMLAIAMRQAQQKDSFSELEHDLNNSELQAMVLQTNPQLVTPLQNGKSLDEMYRQARRVLDGFNAMIENHRQQQAQNQTDHDFELTPQRQDTIAQAIAIINKTATEGHSEAMLWLALQAFRGDRVVE